MCLVEEADNLPELLRRTRGALPDAEVLVVDDNSPDGTAMVAEALGAELGGDPRLATRRKDGLGSAYRAGFSWGIDNGFQILCQMDADLSHDPTALPSLVGPVAADSADLVIGSGTRPAARSPTGPLCAARCRNVRTGTPR